MQKHVAIVNFTGFRNNWGCQATSFELKSPLTGLALALPEPLRKATAETWPLRVHSRTATAHASTAAREAPSAAPSASASGSSTA